MGLHLKRWMLFSLIVLVSLQAYSVIADPENEIKQRTRTAPHKNLGSVVIDGTGREDAFHKPQDVFDDKRKDGSSKVSVSTVAWLTLAMAAATGLGAVPFFFVELDPQWAGICNGMAAGVMLAASFDLIQEGQTHGSGSWVVVGILAGGIFIFLCKKFLEHYGEVSMLDIKGADARKVVLVIGIMTLHSFGEGSGVGVSFAGSKGFSQGLLVTLAIAVHNIPEGLAVSMVLATRGVSPQNAMLWSCRAGGIVGLVGGHGGVVMTVCCKQWGLLESVLQQTACICQERNMRKSKSTKIKLLNKYEVRSSRVFYKDTEKQGSVRLVVTLKIRCSSETKIKLELKLLKV
ncbi:hypothetical protein MKW94_026334 [Papaver nudicaule]|uniref:Zinc transporter n=1 Tax=Papaver nudicaule TaxID=74823 RepID=A0AA41W081_PAPNU|nr:hypothetical protein [Papaver nudicaule]